MIKTKNILSITFILLLVISLSNCSTTVKTSDENHYLKDENEFLYDSLNLLISMEPSTIAFSLEENECGFGKCPVFKIIIFDTGKVLFAGKKHTIKKGIYKNIISKEKVSFLKKEFELSGFFNLDEQAGDNNIKVSDGSSIIISAKADQLYKKIDYYLGTSGIEYEMQLVIKFAHRIKEVAEVINWIE